MARTRAHPRCAHYGDERQDDDLAPRGEDGARRGVRGREHPRPTAHGSAIAGSSRATAPVPAPRASSFATERRKLPVLETARGGILRRGLAVAEASGALITNVTADHLGHYGVMDLETMARVKAVVTMVVGPHRARRVEWRRSYPRRAYSFVRRPGWCSFSLDHEGAGGRRPSGVGRRCLVSPWGVISSVQLQEGERVLATVHEVPITYGGAARFNVANALAGAALASTLGIPDEAIRGGLRAFTPSFEDNPGRSNLVERDRSESPDRLRAQPRRPGPRLCSSSRLLAPSREHREARGSVRVSGGPRRREHARSREDNLRSATGARHLERPRRLPARTAGGRGRGDPFAPSSSR